MSFDNDAGKLRYRILRCNEDKKELLKEKLNYLQKELNEIDKHYEILKENRRKSTIPVVAIVGYSNVGKSSILNILAHENIYVEDKLFATMDPTTRLVTLPSKGEVLFTDTVGFIRKLPNNLLNLFHISIAEIKNADVVIHAIDISAKDFNEKKQVVDDTLDYLGIDKSKIIQVFNKIDLIDIRIYSSFSLFISSTKSILLNTWIILLLYNQKLEIRRGLKVRHLSSFTGAATICGK